MVPRPPKRNEGSIFPISFGGRVPYAPRIWGGFGFVHRLNQVKTGPRLFTIPNTFLDWMLQEMKLYCGAKNCMGLSTRFKPSSPLPAKATLWSKGGEWASFQIYY